jgi:short-subunit dehydrogenase
MSEARYALVTGASSGIGEAFARALCLRGQNVILLARSHDKLQNLAAELSSSHDVRALAYTCDLSRPQAAGEVVRFLKSELLEVNLLINNAAFGGRGEFWRLPLDQQTKMLRLNVQAVSDLTHALLPAMVARRTGGVINVSSITGFQPIPYAALYAASKAFVTSFSMALAEELRPHGIAVVTLCPGGTRTNFQEIGERGRRRFPGKRQEPEEVVQIALKRLAKGGGLVVPRLSNQLTVGIQRAIPRSVLPRVLARFSRPQGQKKPNGK